MSITSATLTSFTFVGYEIFFTDGVRIYRDGVLIDSFLLNESEKFGRRVADCIHKQGAPTIYVEVRHIIWLFKAGYLPLELLLRAEEDMIYILTNVGIGGKPFTFRVVDTFYARA
jgi:hypothetical protein